MWADRHLGDDVHRAARPVGEFVHTSQHVNDSHSVDLGSQALGVSAWQEELMVAVGPELIVGTRIMSRRVRRKRWETRLWDRALGSMDAGDSNLRERVGAAEIWSRSGRVWEPRLRKFSSV